MAGFFVGSETQERMTRWQTRALVLASFWAHLTLALFAGIRRHRDSGVRRSLVWLAYHVTEIGTPIALGMVFIDTAYIERQLLKVLVDTRTVYSEQQLKALVDTTTAYREQQMFALWAPFLLLHLGRPDNITNYSFGNNGLPLFQVLVYITGTGAAIYGSYQQEFMHGDGALRAAFFIMLFLGFYKSLERTVALWRASFAKIRSSHEKNNGLRRFKEEKWDNDDALLEAHGLLGVTMAAFAQFEVHSSCYRYKRSHSDWKYMSKVVEMEASLMYDILYTKASVVYTWGGYIIRVLSLPATATALYLFKSIEAPESADRTVTYILLYGTLVLDVIWMLRALGSTWTYIFLADTEQVGDIESNQVPLPDRQILSDNSRWLDWLKQAGRQVGRQLCYWLRRLLVSLDLSRLLLSSGPSDHRLLSGTGVGQLNLLQECCTPPRSRLSCAGLVKKKNIDVKDELLEVMSTYLVLELHTIVGMRPPREVNDYMSSTAKDYSFESNLIALHIATDIFLLRKQMTIATEASARYEKQIGAISDYMMFLLAERQHMVLKPGDKGRHYKKARLNLEEIWREGGTSDSPTKSKGELANILLMMDATEGSCMPGGPSHLYHDRNDTLGLGAYWAFNLLDELEPGGHGQHPMQGQYIHKLEDFIPAFTYEAQTKIEEYRDCGEQAKLLDYMLQIILVSWVRLLTFTFVQCSRKSHAKQLGCGGELLTIVWLMYQHKYLFYKRRN